MLLALCVSIFALFAGIIVGSAIGFLVSVVFHSLAPWIIRRPLTGTEQILIPNVAVNICACVVSILSAYYAYTWMLL